MERGAKSARVCRYVAGTVIFLFLTIFSFATIGPSSAPTSPVPPTPHFRSIQEILDEAEYHKYPSWVPNYASIAAAPSRYPPRNFCSVTGLQGKYKCPVTGEYIATLEAYETHRETRLKGLI